MGYPDFPIPDQEKSYISAQDMLAFLNLYTKAFNVTQHIKFQHYVVRVRPIGDDDKWEVRLILYFGFIVKIKHKFNLPSYYNNPVMNEIKSITINFS